MDFFDKPWKYINEGNVHIVLQMLGTNYVLRLIKIEGNEVDLETIQNSVDFVNLVMIPLLSLKEHQAQVVVEISDQHIAELSQNLLPFRPEHRKFKAKLSCFAIKDSNLAILTPNCETSYCLEIKSKEGFMSPSFRKFSKCYYCLKQFLKLQDGQIDKMSNYCPLDLFSGDKMRMKQALLHLVKNPQNNLKIFKDGNVIYHEKAKRNVIDNILKEMVLFDNNLNLFLDFIVEILLSDIENNSIVLKESKVLDESQNMEGSVVKCVEGNGLNDSCFLNKLLSLQKLSETFNFNDAAEDKSYEYVQPLISEIKSKNIDLRAEEDKNHFISTADPKILALISAVAKDCSIMISFSTRYEEGFSTIQIGEHKIPFKVSVTDLEPKPTKTLSKRKKSEKKLIELFEEYISSSQSQKIQPHSETRTKQLEAWEQLIADYLKANKQSTIDIRESQNTPLFNNPTINRKLSQEAVVTILEDMAKKGRAAAVDKSKNVWEVYWHSLDEWGNMVYSWACNNGMNNSVCTLFELREGDNTIDEEFHSLDMNVLLKALRALESKGKCELIEFDDNQGVKFF